LTLPESQTKAVKVQMTHYDIAVFNGAKTTIGRFLNSYRMMNYECNPTSFRLQIVDPLLGIPATTKIKALLQDLQTLRRQESNMRIVVFTQYLRTFNACVDAVKRTGIDTYKFSGSTSAKQRDDAIRNFQAAGIGPKAFVITLRAGSVGMNLTAASRVYLLEPCIDPATEIQAAGRIHRLGQTVPVTVVKYFFDNVFEQTILELHRNIAAGTVSMSSTSISGKAVKILTRGL
jgi:DNA repair protein RAD16